MLTEHKNFEIKNLDCPFLKDKQGVETKLKNTLEFYKVCNSSRTISPTQRKNDIEIIEKVVLKSNNFRKKMFLEFVKLFHEPYFLNLNKVIFDFESALKDPNSPEDIQNIILNLVGLYSLNI